jgi:hypothetical protein
MDGVPGRIMGSATSERVAASTANSKKIRLLAARVRVLLGL